jgi:hypothetical protein
MIDFVTMGVDPGTILGMFCAAIGIMCLPEDLARPVVGAIFHVGVDVALIVFGVWMVVKS